VTSQARIKEPHKKKSSIKIGIILTEMQHVQELLNRNRRLPLSEIASIKAYTDFVLPLPYRKKNFIISTGTDLVPV
jgi:hypothetical protein